MMGVSYKSEKGVPQNYKEAAIWFGKAADRGDADADAQAYLGRMYQRGHGFPQDPVQAYQWYSLARASGREDTVKEP